MIAETRGLMLASKLTCCTRFNVMSIVDATAFQSEAVLLIIYVGKHDGKPSSYFPPMVMWGPANAHSGISTGCGTACNYATGPLPQTVVGITMGFLATAPTLREGLKWRTTVDLLGRFRLRLGFAHRTTTPFFGSMILKFRVTSPSTSDYCTDIGKCIHNGDNGALPSQTTHTDISYVSVLCLVYVGDTT